MIKNNIFPRSTPLQFVLRTYQASMFWLPAAIWALVLIVVGIFGKNFQAVTVSSAYTGVVLPLIGGILGAYAFLDDPVLELQFASPRAAFRAIVEKFGVIMLVLAVCSISYQLIIHWIGLDMREYGSIWQRQAAWIVPCIAMTLGGMTAAFGSAQCTTGAMMVGMVWIVEVIARDWFLMTPAAKNFFLFTGALYPKATSVISSQLTILGLSIIFLITGWVLFQKQERFI